MIKMPKVPLSLALVGASAFALIGSAPTEAQQAGSNPPPAAAQPAVRADAPASPGALTPSGPGPTRGVIIDPGTAKSSWCDVTPPCPKGCKPDGARNACVEEK